MAYTRGPLVAVYVYNRTDVFAREYMGPRVFIIKS